MRFIISAFLTVLFIITPALATPTGGNNTCVFPPSTDPSIKLIRTEDAAIPASPISQAAVSGDHIYISGFLPLTPHTGVVVGDDIDSQTHSVLDNCKTVLEAAGSNLGKVVKVTLYLKNVTDYGRVNEIYAEFFGTHRPARSAVAVADIPVGVLIELDMIARI